jgi:hypothetical protein
VPRRQGRTEERLWRHVADDDRLIGRIKVVVWPLVDRRHGHTLLL